MKRRVRMLLGPFRGAELEYPRVEAENLVATGWAAWAGPSAAETPEPGEEPAAPKKIAAKKAKPAASEQSS